jgi:hypothetical protein
MAFIGIGIGKTSKRAHRACRSSCASGGVSTQVTSYTLQGPTILGVRYGEEHDVWALTTTFAMTAEL